MELDSPSASDIMDSVESYVRVLEQLDLSLIDEEIEARFPLWRLVEMNNVDGDYTEFINEHNRRQSQQP